jgi:hypothetical protein
MKARVKSTGEIVEVIAVGDYINEFGQIIGEYKDANGILYTSYDLDFYIEEGITIPDYWTRLEHQYAGMAMQGILANYGVEPLPDDAAHDAYNYAHALVEMMKERRKSNGTRTIFQMSSMQQEGLETQGN